MDPQLPPPAPALPDATSAHDREVLKLAIRSLLTVYCTSREPGPIPSAAPRRDGPLRH